MTFTHSNYDDIHKVISIWIILKPPKEDCNRIYHYETKERNHHDNERMNLVHYIIINLGGPNNRYKGIFKVLDVLLSKDISVHMKNKIFQEITGLPFIEEDEGGDNKMISLGQGIYEDGIHQGRLEGHLEGRLEERERSIYNLVNHLHITRDEAMKLLGIVAKNEKENI